MQIGNIRKKNPLSISSTCVLIDFGKKTDPRSEKRHRFRTAKEVTTTRSQIHTSDD